MLKMHNEKIARKAGYQSPLENGQYMIALPELDEAGEAVRHSGAFKNSRDQPDATRQCTGCFRTPRQGQSC